MTHNGFKVIHVKLRTQNAINNFTPANIEIVKIIYFYGFLQIVLKCKTKILYVIDCILYICTFVRNIRMVYRVQRCKFDKFS